MTLPVIVLRPEPGGSATAARARALGLAVVVAPLFEVRPVEWEMPEGEFDALLLTSANAVRWGFGLDLGTTPIACHPGLEPGQGCLWREGEKKPWPGSNPGRLSLDRLKDRPAFVVGAATAGAAEAAGFTDVRTGASDGRAALDAALASHDRILHFSGRDVSEGLDDPHLTRVVVYAAEELPAPVLPSEGVALLHSARAARRFAGLVDRARYGIVAIGAKVRDAARGEWHEAVAAEVPTDAAMLSLARRLCERGG